MDHHFRKKWGQNFLVDKNLLDKIVSTVNPQANDHILEIGPGEGVLSERILPQVKEMLAIEIDPLLVDQLNKQKTKATTFIKNNSNTHKNNGRSMMLIIKDVEYSRMQSSYKLYFFIWILILSFL